VVLEAQASGLPVIAFQPEGVCDIIQAGRTGWFVSTGTPEEEAFNFERGISWALQDERRANASVEAIRWAATWKWSEAMGKVVEVYREVVDSA
jgi:glycosyltransferase involved in cell wall biosynthesis